MEPEVLSQEEKLAKLKAILEELHKGAKFEELKSKFEELLRQVSPWEIPLVEQELVASGVSPLEIASLCDLHVSLFRDSLLGVDLKDLTPGHPLHTLIMENDEIMKDAEKLALYARSLDSPGVMEELKKLALELRGIKAHFVKEQFLIFPYIERRGLTAVPRVLWTKQDQLVAKIRKLNQTIWQGSDKEEIQRLARDVSRDLMDMVFRENKILYPTLLAMLSEGEWSAIKLEEAEVGYYKVRPGDEWTPKDPIYPPDVKSGISKEVASKLPMEVQALLQALEPVDTTPLIREGDMRLNQGYLNLKELDAMLRTLPFEITFVDADDRLRYFSKKDSMFFLRTKTVLGRKVSLCHPPGSVHLVERIIREFREGKRDVAEFWINMRGRKIYIRYFPVRDEEGNYLGTLEVVQDITDIQKLEGEKRLLDWG